MTIIRVENLTKDYGFGRGVFNISMAIPKGEVYGFLGPNGAGKTTTIRHLMGFSKPDSGRTQIFGLDTFDHYDEILKRVGYIPGEIALPDGLTGYEFLHMMKQLRKIKGKDRIKELLDRFELDPSGDTKRMSFGNKRKLAIVAAFLHDPEVLILDEPTSGLDPVMQDRFIEFVKEEKRRGKTILLSSHIFSEVEAVCDRVSIIKNGQIVDEFPMSKLKYAEYKRYQIVLANDEETMALHQKLAEMTDVVTIDEVTKHEIRLRLHDRDINQLIQLLSHFNVLVFHHEPITLEEYFMQYYIDDVVFEGVSA
ncbi:MAG TPA: ABC transporter ATP-binding protein [Haloplasmataceae bacterium]